MTDELTPQEETQEETVEQPVEVDTSTTLLTFSEYQERKGADPTVLNGFHRAAQARNIVTSGSYTEEQWNSIFTI